MVLGSVAPFNMIDGGVSADIIYYGRPGRELEGTSQGRSKSRKYGLV